MSVFHEFPKWKYHPTKEAVVVPSQDAESALGDAWFDTPAYFCKPSDESAHGARDMYAVPLVKTKKRSKP